MSDVHKSHPDAAASGTPPAIEKPVSELSIEDIDRLVARGHALRAAYVAQAGRRLFQSWTSLWRRPGRLYKPRTVG